MYCFNWVLATQKTNNKQKYLSLRSQKTDLAI